ncbi:hypothetical protein [Solirubrum puertoriconensis]|uniref:Lipoprotein n=1 Tax=Solirubrum puertoriconensis TaxID=1751427 RepID=A0A9X0HKX4_SOLP1|nr:hypothetical protein [Solirubrum puertoriconensis]KUG07786.1 hypothetical protein ASU33_15870 [Solirubrum puertoriconensis]
MLRRVYAAATLALGLALVGCDNTTEAPADLGKDYYPLAVGTTRVYQVEDRVWRNNQITSSSTSQVREQLIETYRDAAGKLTYKLLRSVRPNATAEWQPDSAHTLTVNDRNLLLTRSNVRSVELIFPVRAGAEWNKQAFIAPNDPTATVGDINRRYEEVGVPFSIGGRNYENTVSTFDEGADPLFKIYRHTVRQVYAKGIGPVYRERIKYDYCQGTSGSCSIGTDYIEQGWDHKETLLQ